jgi:hypothetical protein
MAGHKGGLHTAAVQLPLLCPHPHAAVLIPHRCSGAVPTSSPSLSDHPSARSVYMSLENRVSPPPTHNPVFPPAPPTHPQIPTAPHRSGAFTAPTGGGASSDSGSAASMARALSCEPLSSAEELIIDLRGNLGERGRMRP